MKTPRWIARRAPLLCFALVLSSFLSLSFAPNVVKKALHTRGSLHTAAHVGCFALLRALLFVCVPAQRGRRLQTTGMLVLLALSVECLQTQGMWRNLEVADVLSDTLGLGLAVVVERLLWLVRNRGSMLHGEELRMSPGARTS